MSIQSFGTITPQDIEDARQDVAHMKRTRAAAKERLIRAGVLTEDGKPRWPTGGENTPNTRKK